MFLRSPASDGPRFRFLERVGEGMEVVDGEGVRQTPKGDRARSMSRLRASTEDSHGLTLDSRYRATILFACR